MRDLYDLRRLARIEPKQTRAQRPASVSIVRRRTFVDTNVLIYASRAAEPLSETACDALEAAEG